MNPIGRPSLNAHGQPVGCPLPGWRPPGFPEKLPMDGRYCRLEPLAVGSHAERLFEAYSRENQQQDWTYLPYGPFSEFEQYRQWLETVATAADPLFHTVVLKDGNVPAGVASYLRIKPEGGSIEVGHLHFSDLMKRSPAATEAMFLMMRRAFDLGYRRYEWKCDALNAPSCAAARRLGFSFEGVFRNATVYKGRNRDTAWFAVVDSDWPALEMAFEKWLDPANFDDTGKQRISLRELTRPMLRPRLDPG